jgi:hypothetical protein
MNTDIDWAALSVFMGSGFAASQRPGMTIKMTRARAGTAARAKKFIRNGNCALEYENKEST